MLNNKESLRFRPVKTETILLNEKLDKNDAKCGS